jgi:hypothetical protein
VRLRETVGLIDEVVMLKPFARAVAARNAEVQTHEITLRTHRQGPRAAEMQQIRRWDKSAFNHVAVAAYLPQMFRMRLSATAV